jgi:hypothetical protein
MRWLLSCFKKPLSESNTKTGHYDAISDEEKASTPLEDSSKTQLQTISHHLKEVDRKYCSCKLACYALMAQIPTIISFSLASNENSKHPSDERVMYDWENTINSDNRTCEDAYNSSIPLCDKDQAIPCSTLSNNWCNGDNIGTIYFVAGLVYFGLTLAVTLRHIKKIISARTYLSEEDVELLQTHGISAEGNAIEVAASIDYTLAKKTIPVNAASTPAQQISPNFM